MLLQCFRNKKNNTHAHRQERDGNGIDFEQERDGSGSNSVSFFPGVDRIGFLFYFYPGIGTGQDYFVQEWDGTGVKKHSRVSL